MGCTGVGKSQFVKTIGAISMDTDGIGPVVGDGLESCKSYILRVLRRADDALTRHFRAQALYCSWYQHRAHRYTGLQRHPRLRSGDVEEDQ